MGERGRSDGFPPHGEATAAKDCNERGWVVAIAREREVGAVCVRALDGFAGTCLEPEQHGTTWAQYAPDLADDSLEIGRRGVDDRVPADRTVQTSGP